MSNCLTDPSLALNGGEPFRKKAFPFRRLFGENELRAVEEVFHSSWNSKQDFGYQERFENEYTDAFSNYMGGGCTDAVCSGSAAVYLALNALDIKKGSDIIISPVTDPGSVSAVILQGYNPVVADSAPGDFNIGAEQFEAALTPKTRGAVVTHLGGRPLDMDSIMTLANVAGIPVVEDCSQAPGSEVKGRKIGTFGNIAAFSTMNRKIIASGGSGGLVFTRDRNLYNRVRSTADRGKPFHSENFNPKDPGSFERPGFNWNLDEISCAIGRCTLAKLDETIGRRKEIVDIINNGLSASRFCVPLAVNNENLPSYFFHTVLVKNLPCPKTDFARAIIAEGIPLNPDYRYVVAEWAWMKKHLPAGFITPNASGCRQNSFNILFNEKYTDRDAEDIVGGILKVENTLP